MRLHVLTLTWNGKEKLKRLEEGLFNNLIGFDFTWHIRDNGSKDGTVEEFQNKENIKVYDIGHNRDNFAQGMNYLFDAAKPEDDDLILLLNNDVTFVSNNSLTKMYNLMEQTDAGVVGARLLYPKSDLIQHCGVAFSAIKYNSLPYHYRHKEKLDIHAEKNRYFQAVTAAVCLVQASSFIRVGGFDKGFVWAFDDVDLALAIGKTGQKIVYCGETNITHEESASLKKNPVNRLFMDKNVKYFREKWAGKYKIDYELYQNNPDYGLV